MTIRRAASGGLAAVFFVFLLVALLAYLAHAALVSPDVPFLPPATHGEWIVPLGPVFHREAVFNRRFDLPAVSDRYPIRIRAMRESEISVNGAALPGTQSRDWKRPAAYDLTSVLRAGRNEIRIRVSVPAPPPALLVEGPALVRTDGRWTVELRGTGERPAAVAYEDDRRVSDRPNPLRVSPTIDCGSRRSSCISRSSPMRSYRCAGSHGYLQRRRRTKRASGSGGASRSSCSSPSPRSRSEALTSIRIHAAWTGWTMSDTSSTSRRTGRSPMRARAGRCRSRRSTTCSVRGSTSSSVAPRSRPSP